MLAMIVHVRHLNSFFKQEHTTTHCICALFFSFLYTYHSTPESPMLPRPLRWGTRRELPPKTKQVANLTTQLNLSLWLSHFISPLAWTLFSPYSEKDDPHFFF